MFAHLFGNKPASTITTIFYESIHTNPIRNLRDIYQ